MYMKKYDDFGCPARNNNQSEIRNDNKHDNRHRDGCGCVCVETKCVTLRKVEPFEWCEKRINNIDKCLYCDWKPMRAYELSQIREWWYFNK